MFNLTIASLSTTIVVVAIGAISLTALSFLLAQKTFFRQPSLVMSVAVTDSIASLSQSSETEMFSEIDFTKQIFEHLYNSDNAQIPKEDLYRDLARLLEIAEHIRQAEDLRRKSEIYYSEYKSLSNELRTKYREFLPDDAFSQIESKERYMDALKKFMTFTELMLQAFEKEKNPTIQAAKLYSGMVQLSGLLDDYAPDLTNRFFAITRTIASAILGDSSLQPNNLVQPRELFASLTGLRQASRGVLWQIENLKESLLGGTATIGAVLEYLKTAPKWEGDDFEECLKDVNDARK